jgi:putative protease
MNWVRMLEKKSSDRRIGVWARLDETSSGFALTLTDEDGHTASAQTLAPKEPAKNAAQAETSLREHLARFGTTIFEPIDITLNLSAPRFIPASVLNPLRRDAVQALEAARTRAYERPPRALAVEPPVAYPEDTLTYLANVFNDKARAFYARHGVKVIAAAYESHEEEGEVSLMITKHCVRFSLSLCPKQAKGVTGVQGTIRAEPLTLINGKEKLTLRFDCKPCEMHVVGKIKKAVLNQTAREAESVPLKFYRTRPVASTPA